MGKALAGFLIGFFLAIFFFCLVIKVTLGPYEQQINEARPYIEQMYSISHSSAYGAAQSGMSWLSGITNLPVIGQLLSPFLIPQGTKAASEVMVGVKETSEKVLMTMQILSTLISISLPGMAISFVIVIIGFVMLAKAKTESKEKDEEKEEEKEIPHKHGKQYCHNCGAAVSKKDEFCGECGEKIKK